MKKVLSFLLSALLLLSMTACTGTSGSPDNTQSSEAAEASKQVLESTHKIGVLVYDLSDPEVLSFKDYLENYIANCFEGVEFIYSDDISSAEQDLEFIQNAIDSGAEGIMSFNSYDLEQEVKLCADNGVYFMMASSTLDEDSFNAVKENPYFLGVVGPGSQMEYEAGQNMAQYFYDQKYGDSYFILSGGSSMGNEMHLQRTLGILDTLEKAYGVTFEESTEDMAVKTETKTYVAGNLSVCIAPGYLSMDQYLDAAKEAYAAGTYANVLSAMNLTLIADTLSDSKVGCVDCFSDENLTLSNKGNLAYVTGKYRSIIGPSFVAMYNAVCGYARNFRDQGNAFSLTQGFWTAEGKEEYEDRYALSSSIELNAYNYEDLMEACSVYNQDASLDELKKLVEAYTFEDACTRRNLK